MIFDIKQLRKIRKQLNLTQHQFAQQAGVSQSMIAKIESGKLDPTYSYVKRIEETINQLTKQEEKEAHEIMQKKVITLNKSESLKKAAHLISKYDISQIPIIEQNRIIGLITESIIIKHLTEPNKKLDDIMEEVPPLISKNTRLSAIITMLKFFPILLVQEKGKLIGVITKADLIKNI